MAQQSTLSKVQDWLGLGMWVLIGVTLLLALSHTLTDLDSLLLIWVFYIIVAAIIMAAMAVRRLRIRRGEIKK